MKADTQDPLMPAPREEHSILDQIRNDHELIARLKITPEEIDALSRCALLGTLTCKQDMLFILRQIREACDHGHAAPVPQQDVLPEDDEEDSIPDFRRMPVRTALATMPEPASLEDIVRRRMPEQLGVLFWAMVMAVGLGWSALTAISRWRDNFMTTITGLPVDQAPPLSAWYSHIDRPNVLLCWEILFVGCVALVMYFRSRKRSQPRLRMRRRLR